MGGCSSVVVSLGGPTKGPGVDICSKAQVLINQAVLSMSPQPLVILVSSIGVGDHYQHCSLFAKFFASCIIPQAIADKNTGGSRSLSGELDHRTSWWACGHPEHRPMDCGPRCVHVFSKDTPRG